MSTIKGYVQDFDTEDQLEDVEIYLMKKNSNQIDKKLGTTDENGDFEFEAQPIGSPLQFARVGYEPLFMSQDFIGSSGRVELNKVAGATLTDVVITAKKKKVVDKPDYTLPIVLGSVAVVTATIWAFKRFG